MKLKDKLHRFALEKTTLQTENQAGNLDQVLHGYEVANAFGSYYLVENEYEADYRHGGFGLSQVLECNCKNLAFIAKDNDIAAVKLEDAVFFDTETTGLSGGAGTCAFLIGVGYFRADKFVLKQYLMRDYNEEVALLYDLKQMFSHKQAVISFNGKSFDWPLIKDRFTIARFEPFRRKHIHLDLLYPARRLWRHRLETCSLNSIEQNILAVTRTNDIPGADIPQRFFDFVCTRDGALLSQVLSHNRIDILSLTALVSHYDQVVRQGPQDLYCPWESYGLARLYGQDKDWVKAGQFYKRAVELGSANSIKFLSLSQLGLVYRRLRRWEAAEQIWQRLVKDKQDIQACEELAKYYEHVAKDYQRAEIAARQGLALSIAKDHLRVAAFEYRLDRIRNKIDSTTNMQAK